MVSRYFTDKSGHFPNENACIEVTADGRYIHHKDDGSTAENTDLKVPALQACMTYVRNGNWIEILEVPAPRDRPSTPYPDVW